VKRHRYILHAVIIGLVLIAMTAPAWWHVPWRYLLGSLSAGLLIVALALAVARAFVPNTGEE
jgi:hypothetical protein